MSAFAVACAFVAISADVPAADDAWMCLLLSVYTGTSFDTVSLVAGTAIVRSF